MKQKITLVQKVATLQEFVEMQKNKQLPIVLKVTKEEWKTLEKFEFLRKNGLDLIFNPSSMIEKDETFYLRINDERLKTLIEANKIYIPTFIDLEGNKKYVDYIHQSHSFDFGNRLVFRDKPRLLACLQGNYSIKRNQAEVTYLPSSIGYVTGFLNRYSENSEEIFNLGSRAINDHVAKQLSKKI